MRISEAIGSCFGDYREGVTTVLDAALGAAVLVTIAFDERIPALIAVSVYAIDPVSPMRWSTETPLSLISVVMVGLFLRYLDSRPVS